MPPNDGSYDTVTWNTEEKLLMKSRKKIESSRYPVHMPESSEFGKCVICGKKGLLGMECSRCGEDSGGRYL